MATEVFKSERRVPLNGLAMETAPLFAGTVGADGSKKRPLIKMDSPSCPHSISLLYFENKHALKILGAPGDFEL